MIIYQGRKLTPKQAAKIIIEDGISQGITHWSMDTDPGQEIEPHLTARETRAVNDQISKILTRMSRYLR